MKILHCSHSFLWHILLSEHLSEFFRAIVTIVNEDNYIAFFDNSVYFAVVDWLDKLVGYAFIITFLHSLHHVISLLSFALYKQIIGLFHTIPSLIAVHCIESSNNTCDVSTIVLAAVLNLFYKAFTTLWVGISAVHKAMNIYIFESVFLANFNQFE